MVRAFMWLCAPVAWPLAKLLDKLLGPDHHTLFRRRQLKELVRWGGGEGSGAREEGEGSSCQLLLPGIVWV